MAEYGVVLAVIAVIVVTALLALRVGASTSRAFATPVTEQPVTPTDEGGWRSMLIAIADRRLIEEVGQTMAEYASVFSVITIEHRRPRSRSMSGAIDGSFVIDRRRIAFSQGDLDLASQQETAVGPGQPGDADSLQPKVPPKHDDHEENRYSERARPDHGRVRLGPADPPRGRVQHHPVRNSLQPLHHPDRRYARRCTQGCRQPHRAESNRARSGCHPRCCTRAQAGEPRRHRHRHRMGSRRRHHRRDDISVRHRVLGIVVASGTLRARPWNAWNRTPRSSTVVPYKQSKEGRRS